MKTKLYIAALIAISVFLVVFVNQRIFPQQSDRKLSEPLVQKVLNEKAIISVVIDYGNPQTVLAASGSTIFKTIDQGKTWSTIDGIHGVGNTIHKLYQHVSNPHIFYAATSNGLYQSTNQGKDWKIIFRGNSELERNCLCFAQTGKELFIGTESGLFIFTNEGKWRLASSEFAETIVTNVLASPDNESLMWVACNKGVYESKDTGKNWERIFVVANYDINPEDYSDFDGTISTTTNPVEGLFYQRQQGKLFLAINKKIYCREQGRQWKSVSNIGLPVCVIHSMAGIASKPLLLTNKGMYVLSESPSWRKVNMESISDDFSEIVYDGANWFWCAGKDGIYKINKEIFDADKKAGDDATASPMSVHVSLEDILRDEPPINEVQKRALVNAEATMDKIKAWRRQARLKAFVPTLSLGYDKTIYGSSNGAMAVGPLDWSANFSWNIGDLIWSSDQTSIDSRSRLTVQLQQDILDQLNHLYYERARIKLDLFTQTMEEKDRLLKQIELQEITASLDGLTSGFYSQFLTNQK